MRRRRRQTRLPRGFGRFSRVARRPAAGPGRAGRGGQVGARRRLAERVSRPGGTLGAGDLRGTGRESKFLRAHAAAAVAAGIPEDAAFAAITRTRRRSWASRNRLGSLAVGKDADLAVFAGDPLDPSTPVRMTVVGGRNRPPAVRSRRAERAAGRPPGPSAALPEAFVLQSKNVLLPDGRMVRRGLRVVRGKIDAIDPPPRRTRRSNLGDALIAPGLVAGNSRL